MTTMNQPYAPSAPATKVRPTGVTILAILNALSALASIFGGLLIITATSVTGIFAGLGAAVGGVVLIIGLIQLVIAWGLWTGKGWAWILGLIFGILGILSGLVSIMSGGILTLVINLIIVYYLFQPRVKTFFGR